MVKAPQTLRRWARSYRENRCSLLAAAIAYRVLFSIIPVTALLVAGATRALRVPQIEHQVVDRVIERIPLDRGLVTDGLRAMSDSSEPLTILGMIALLWASAGMFSTLRETLNVASSVSGRSFVRQKLVDVAAVLGLGVLVVISILGTGALHTIRNIGTSWMGELAPRAQWLWGLAASILPATVTFVAFLLVYRYVPNVSHRVRDVLPGALLGGGLFEGAKHGFAYYASNFARYEIHGALGTVLLFQLWIYVSASILLAGAVLNAVLRGPTPPPIHPVTVRAAEARN
jgi:membrane protein